MGIPHLAQAVMAIVLQRPDTARARPSSLLKKDDDYAKVYNPKYPIQVYHVCAETIRRVESYLKKQESGGTPQDRNNLRFYVAMHAVLSVLGKKNPNVKQISELELSGMDEQAIQASFAAVKQEYDELGGNDQIAKGPSLLEAVRNLVQDSN